MCVDVCMSLCVSVCLCMSACLHVRSRGRSVVARDRHKPDDVVRTRGVYHMRVALPMPASGERQQPIRQGSPKGPRVRQRKEEIEEVEGMPGASQVSLLPEFDQTQRTAMGSGLQS